MIRLYTDGASSGDPGPSGVGIVYVLADGTTKEDRYFIGSASNHEAEFMALRIGLLTCLHHGWRQVSVCTDAKLVCDSVEKRYVKNKHFSTHLQVILKQVDQCELFFIKWIPSKQNKKADALAKLALREPLRRFNEEGV
ncbi:RNase HI [Shouchella lonarensis]|uniref:RNase HI n=2 Tax=Shouchella lonarensis TaxID=1464122 RepID=A0A1G6HE89_9BACI|nr:RNase HI [Shouchella lonarensis]